MMRKGSGGKSITRPPQEGAPWEPGGRPHTSWFDAQCSAQCTPQCSAQCSPQCSAMLCSATNVSAIPTRKIFGQLADMHDNGSRDDHDHDSHHHHHHKENDPEISTMHCSVESTFYISLFRHSIQHIKINVATSYFKHSQCNVLIIMKIEPVHVCVSLR